jgi:hypothetical protein
VPNLIEGMHEQMDRCRELLKQYEAIGPAGAFGKAAITAKIKAAEAAIANGDVVAMLRTFAALKECE